MGMSTRQLGTIRYQLREGESTQLLSGMEGDDIENTSSLLNTNIRAIEENLELPVR